MRAVASLAGRPPLRLGTPGFAGLTRIVVGQQVSVAAAEAIYARLCSIVGSPSPAAILALDEEQMRLSGLSRPKQRTMLAIATAVRDGMLDIDGLGDLSDEDIVAQMTAVKGIGPWTADIYLMFCLRRADSWAPGDLALQLALADALGTQIRPSLTEMNEIAAPWRPWRGVAARLLWSYYAVRRQQKSASSAQPV